MALTFPRAMPASGAARQTFEVQRSDLVSTSQGGATGAITAGFPLWRGDWTVSQARTFAEEWRAFAASLRGAQRLFLGRDYSRPYPLAYANGLGVVWPSGFSGSAGGWSVNGDRDVLTLSLPSGFVISRNDYVAFRWASLGEARRSLVRAVEPTIAAGGSATFAIEPPLPALTPSGATATLDKPDCLMRQVPDQSQIGEQDRRLAVANRLVGLQVLLA
jgi:hypothetical protein